LTSNAYQLVVDGPSYRQRQRPGHPGPPPGGGPTPASARANSGTAGVKAKPSGRPPAGLDPSSSPRRPRRTP
jgi:hypothetical protein